MGGHILKLHVCTQRPSSHLQRKMPHGLRQVTVALLAAGMLLHPLVGRTDIVSSGANTANAPTTIGNANLGNTWLGIGQGGVGSLSMSGGSQLTTGALVLGTNFVDFATGSITGFGNGTSIVDGVGTRVTLVGDGFNVVNRLEMGGWGVGAMTVSGGAFIDGRSQTAGCELEFHYCNSFISNAAGSNGTLTVTGAGSTVALTRYFGVGNGSVFRPPIDSWHFGTPGGTTQARLNILNGGTLITDSAGVGNVSTQPSALGNERTFADVVIDGAGSTWHITGASIPDWNPNADYGGILSTAHHPNAWATITLSNGGKLIFDDKPGYTQIFNLTSGFGTGSAGRTDMIVDGVGSELRFDGADSYLRVGRIGAGGTATMTVRNGGRVGGVNNLTVGRDGTLGTLTIDGTGSRVVVDGRQTAGVENATHGQVALLGGPFHPSVVIGRGGGAGTVNVVNGGVMELLATETLTTGSPVFDLARDVNSSGALNINGAGSVVRVVTNPLVHGSGAGETFNPLVRVGRDGTGILNVSNGGKLLIEGNAVSTLSDPRFTFLYIGGNSSFGVGGKGIATVTGVGSEIRLTGADTFVHVGSGAQATGQLTVSNGASVSAMGMRVGGGGGVGILKLDGASMTFAGEFTGSAQTGASLVVGSGGGVGVASIHNSTLSITNPGVSGAGLILGGTGSQPGGDGNLTISGGSTVAVSAGPGLGIVTIGRSGSGLARIKGGSVLDVSGGNLYLGRESGSDGVLIATEGAQIFADWVGVGRNKLGATSVDGGTGTMVLNGATLHANTIVIGTNGFLGGSNGSIIANAVHNYGVFSPGSSPGTMTIDADYIAEAGSKMILEIESDGMGGFLTDKVIFTSGRVIDLSQLNVEYRFLGATDPNAFQSSGSFDIDTFLVLNTLGSLSALPDAAFDGVQFSARSDAYQFQSFSYTVAQGAVFSAAPVPEAETWAMLVAGLALTGLVARRRRQDLEREALSALPASA